MYPFKVRDEEEKNRFDWRCEWKTDTNFFKEKKSFIFIQSANKQVLGTTTKRRLSF